MSFVCSFGGEKESRRVRDMKNVSREKRAEKKIQYSQQPSPGIVGCGSGWVGGRKIGFFSGVHAKTKKCVFIRRKLRIVQ